MLHSSLSTHNDDVATKAKNVIDTKKEKISVNSSLILNVPSLPSTYQYSHKTQQIISHSGHACRICHEDGGQEPLISPCACTGTVGLAHATCVEQWLTSSNTTNCEICNFQYNILVESKSVFQWLQAKSLHNGPSGFYGDALLLMFLTPICFGSVYLCAEGANAYLKQGLWEGMGLAVLCCFLIAIYIFWCFAAFRFHWKRFKRWQMANKTVRLLGNFNSVNYLKRNVQVM